MQETTHQSNTDTLIILLLSLHRSFQFIYLLYKNPIFTQYNMLVNNQPSA